MRECVGLTLTQTLGAACSPVVTTSIPASATGSISRRVRVTFMRSIVICLLLALGQASSQVIIRVNDANPVTWDARTLAELPRQSVTLQDHGKSATYEGVLLHDVLVRSGVDFAKGLRGKQLSTYVTGIGSDGYTVLYALADFDPTITNSAIILADKRDGKPLERDEGPLRIVVPQEKRPARSVRMLKEIDVVQLSKQMR